MYRFFNFSEKKISLKVIEMFNFDTVKQFVESLTVHENFDPSSSSTTTASPMVLLITTIIYFMLILTFGQYLWNNVLVPSLRFYDASGTNVVFQLKNDMTASHILGLSILINLLKA